MCKYGIIVVSYDNEFYRSLDRIRSKQLLSSKIPFAVVYNGKGPNWKMQDWEHYIVDDRMNPTMYNKFVYVSNILLSHPEWAGLDFILRINSSTFLNIHELARIFLQLPKTQCYAGRPLETFPYHPAEIPVKSLSSAGISGMYTIFTKDVVKQLFDYNLNEQNCNDDVALGINLFKLNIPRTLINDYLVNINDIPDTDEKYNKALDYTFVRIKNETNRQIDLNHWNNLYSAYTKKYV